MTLDLIEYQQTDTCAAPKNAGTWLGIAMSALCLGVACSSMGLSLPQQSWLRDLEQLVEMPVQRLLRQQLLAARCTCASISMWQKEDVCKQQCKLVDDRCDAL